VDVLTRNIDHYEVSEHRAANIRGKLNKRVQPDNQARFQTAVDNTLPLTQKLSQLRALARASFTSHHQNLVILDEREQPILATKGAAWSG
jgi:hypothetical protein